MVISVLILAVLGHKDLRWVGHEGEIKDLSDLPLVKMDRSISHNGYFTHMDILCADQRDLVSLEMGI